MSGKSTKRARRDHDGADNEVSKYFPGEFLYQERSRNLSLIQGVISQSHLLPKFG